MNVKIQEFLQEFINKFKLVIIQSNDKNLYCLKAKPHEFLSVFSMTQATANTTEGNPKNRIYNIRTQRVRKHRTI